MCNRGDLTWRTSTRSAGGNCVEVAAHGDHVHVRDSKDPDGPMLTVDLQAWRDLVTFAVEGAG